MAETHVESREHETAPSTPASQREGSGSKMGKDKQCPFCGQAFTSSSLGRHLDLYIKPRNPKPPDGMHDVNEIRKLRGSITRRQPKTSLKPGANVNVSGWRSESMESTPNTASGSRAAPKIEPRIMDGSPVTSPVEFRECDGMHMSLNTANWQATGVINNLPPRAPSRNNTAAPTSQAHRIDAMRRDAAGARIERPEYDSEDTSKLREDAEVGRAAELALREVLGSLEAAKCRTEPAELFEGVDFFSLTFPGLVLAVLPAPSTLFSTTPFAGAETWGLTPPGRQQYDAFNRFFTTAYKKRQRESEYFPDSLAFKYGAHAAAAWEHWEQMPQQDQASAWNLELCRSYLRAQEQKQQVQREHEAAKTRIRHLEAEYDRLSRCQLPREFLLHPANTLPAPVEVIKELSSASYPTAAAEAGYDADALINKWRTTVKATMRRPPAAVSQSHHTAPTYPDSRLGADMVLNGAVLGVNGAMPRNTDMRGVKGSDHAAAVDYETPPNPGAIVSVEEDEADEDADGEVEDGGAGTYGLYSDCGALVRQQIQPWALNGNGKRPLAPDATSGRAEGPKMYKERRSERGREAREQAGR